MSDENSVAKKPKLCESEGQSQVASGTSSIEQITPKIFKLDVDCFDEIFEYLSIKDLHSFGQTCTAMHKVAGGYFKQNHWAAEKFCHKDGIYTVYSEKEDVLNVRTQTSGFNQFITNISHYYHDQKPLRYIRSHIKELKSIKHIYLVCLNLNKNRIDYIQKLFQNIDTLQLRNCSIDGDVYELILKHCIDLKRLYLQRAALGHSWLLQSYPKLEYLELIPIPTTDILKSFFERNSTLRTFSTSAWCIWDNKETFLKSTGKIETLEVKMLYEHSNENFDALCQLLNQIQQRGFFKRLHIYIVDVTEVNSTQLASLNGLEMICIKNMNKCYNLPRLINLKELAIYNSRAADMEILANSFVHLQRLFLRNATYDHLLPFISRASQLSKVRVIPANGTDFNGGILKLQTLNIERKKLTAPRKVTIYVPDNIFLKTKWTTCNGDTNLQLIEMKRADSYEWDNHYSHKM